jgi:hypothetical protein
MPRAIQSSVFTSTSTRAGSRLRARDAELSALLSSAGADDADAERVRELLRTRPDPVRDAHGLAIFSSAETRALEAVPLPRPVEPMAVLDTVNDELHRRHARAGGRKRASSAGSRSRSQSTCATPRAHRRHPFEHSPPSMPSSTRSRSLRVSPSTSSSCITRSRRCASTARSQRCCDGETEMFAAPHRTARKERFDHLYSTTVPNVTASLKLIHTRKPPTDRSSCHTPGLSVAARWLS